MLKIDRIGLLSRDEIGVIVILARAKQGLAELKIDDRISHYKGDDMFDGFIIRRHLLSYIVIRASRNPISSLLFRQIVQRELSRKPCLEIQIAVYDKRHRFCHPMSTIRGGMNIY